MNRRELYFIAGPNGSGKSTLINHLVKEKKLPYICPDQEALLLSEIKDKQERDRLAWENARKKRSDLLEKGISFINETVFSHESHLEFLKAAKQNGYHIISFYVIIESAEKCIERVKQRVSEGGHGVDFNKVATRYNRSLSLLPKLIELADSCAIVDNTTHYDLLLYKEKNTLILCQEKDWFNKKVVNNLKKDYSFISVRNLNLNNK